MPTRTAGEAGWHESLYNLRAQVPGTNRVAIANLYRGTCVVLGPLERYLLSVVGELSQDHPIIARLARLGFIANFDERAALEAMGRAACAGSRRVTLTVCPTMACNFDCPYCFERRGQGRMSQEVQQEVASLAGRMMDASRAKVLRVVWYGGEPLLAPNVIQSLSSSLMAKAAKRGVEYRGEIITNGHLLSPQVAKMLGKAGVRRAQVTLDGIGDAHDATRHLVDGGGTFNRIAQNLLQSGLPFSVRVRHNVHEGNRNQMQPLRELVERMAVDSGNDISYYATPLRHNERAEARGSQTGLVCKGHVSKLAVARAVARFGPARGCHCGAQSLWSIGVDAQGGLYKCWESVDKPELSFGCARDWDPCDPLATASRPNMLTCFLNAAGPAPDEECAGCVWLPRCVGGCPYQRLFGEGKRCVAYRNDPEAFVLALATRT